MSELGNDNEKERQTEDCQRGYENRIFEGDTRSLGIIEISGNEHRTFQISANRTFSERTNSGKSTNSSRDPIIGGIIRQLIAQSRKQLDYRLEDIRRFESQVQEIKQQIQEWEELLDTLEKSIEESEQQN